MAISDYLFPSSDVHPRGGQQTRFDLLSAGNASHAQLLDRGKRPTHQQVFGDVTDDEVI